MDAKQYGWPITAPVKIIGSKVFIEARRGLTPYGYFNEKQCKRGVFKQLEQFLKLYGLQDTDIYMEKTCKDYISAEAFILTLIAGIKLRDPTRNQIQFAWTQLCMFFTATIIKATFGKENQDVGTGNNITCTTCTTATTFTPNTVMSTETMPQPFHGCIRTHYATSTLVERLLSGQSSRSTQLEERVKEQNRVFSNLAKNVHHGSKVCR